MTNLADKSVDLADAAGRGLRFSGTFEIGALARLAEIVRQSRADSVGGDAGVAHVEARLEFGQSGRPAHVTIRGEIAFRCGLMCQRCLELAPVSGSLPVAVAVCDPDANEDALQESGIAAERWDHGGNDLRLADFVDECIVLSLPLVVTHADGADCGPLARQAVTPEPDGNDRQTPFAGLAALMSRGASD